MSKILRLGPSIYRHLQINQTSLALNNPQGSDLPLKNKLNQTKPNLDKLTMFSM